MTKKQQKYLKTREVMELFGVSRQAVYEWRKDGCPHIGHGLLIFYEEDKIRKWIESRDCATKVKKVKKADVKEVIESNYPNK